MPKNAKRSGFVQVVQSKEKIQRQTEKLLKDKGNRDIERAELEKSRNALKGEVPSLFKENLVLRQSDSSSKIFRSRRLGELKHA